MSCCFFTIPDIATSGCCVSNWDCLMRRPVRAGWSHGDIRVDERKRTICTEISHCNCFARLEVVVTSREDSIDRITNVSSQCLITFGEVLVWHLNVVYESKISPSRVESVVFG
jgi:hypothetical protein